MQVRRDNSGISQTCPMINEVIDFINYAHLIDDKEELIAQAKVFIDIMEDIRGHNEKLREWGNDMYQEKEDLEKQVEKLNHDLLDSEFELMTLKRQLDEN